MAGKPNPARDFEILFDQAVAVAACAMEMRKPDCAERLELLRTMAESRRHIDGYQATEDRVGRIADLVTTWGNPALFVRQPIDLTDATGKMVLARNTDLGATPETMAKPSRVSPVSTLYRGKLIDRDGVRAAKEIAWVVEEVTRVGGARAQMLQAAGGTSPFWRQYMNGEAAAVWTRRYVPWSEKQKMLAQAYGTRSLQATLAVVVFGEGLAAARARFRVGMKRLEGWVASGINDYAVLMDQDDKSGWSARLAADEADEAMA